MSDSRFVKTIIYFANTYHYNINEIRQLAQTIERLADHIEPLACKLLKLYFDGEMNIRDIPGDKFKLNSPGLHKYLSGQIRRLKTKDRDETQDKTQDEDKDRDKTQDEDKDEIDIDPVSTLLENHLSNTPEPHQLLSLLETVCFNNPGTCSEYDPQNILLCNDRISVAITPCLPLS